MVILADPGKENFGEFLYITVDWVDFPELEVFMIFNRILSESIN